MQIHSTIEEKVSPELMKAINDAINTGDSTQVTGLADYISSYMFQAYDIKKKSARYNKDGLIREQVRISVHNHYDRLPLEQRRMITVHDMLRDVTGLKELTRNNPLVLGTFLGVVRKKYGYSEIEYNRETRTFNINKMIGN